jgi:MEDS: MEthanogen/methylotroph, DcmR Sensory domain
VGPVGEPVDIGVGEPAATGDHICALYSGPVERDAILLPFIRSALRSGDKCVCVIDSTEPADLLSAIALDTNIDLTACLASRQFDLLRAADTTMRSGRFNPADMVGFWKASLAGVMNTGRYQCVRAASETALSLRDLPDSQEVVQHESEMNRMLPLYPQVLLCLYDLEKVGGAFLVDLMSMHPRVLVNGRLTENVYYLAPDEWLARQGA